MIFFGLCENKHVKIVKKIIDRRKINRESNGLYLKKMYICRNESSLVIADISRKSKATPALSPLTFFNQNDDTGRDTKLK